jgi:hypothetical protein
MPRGFPCCAQSPCVHAVATAPAQRLGLQLTGRSRKYQPSPKGLFGRPAHCPFLARRSLAACTLVLSLNIVTRQPKASVISFRRVGFASTGGCRLIERPNEWPQGHLKSIGVTRAIRLPPSAAIQGRIIVGADRRMRCEKSGDPPAACAAALIRERRRSSANGSVVSTRPEW